jgi:hypothetical protein
VIVAVVRSYLGVEWHEVELEEVVSIALDESEDEADQESEKDNDSFVDHESNIPGTMAAEDYNRGMLRYLQLRKDFNRLSVDFLKVDAELALTFASVAQNLHHKQAGAESVRHARTAFDYISERRSQIPISRADAIELDRKLAFLRKRLEGLGEQF